MAAPWWSCEGLTDREERRVRGLELLLTVCVTLVSRAIGLESYGGRRRGVVEVCTGEHAVALQREQAHRARDADLGRIQWRDGTAEHVGQHLAPLRGAGSTTDEHDLGDRLAREGLDVR